MAPEVICDHHLRIFAQPGLTSWSAEPVILARAFAAFVYQGKDFDKLPAGTQGVYKFWAAYSLCVLEAEGFRVVRADRIRELAEKIAAVADHLEQQNTSDGP